MGDSHTSAGHSAVCRRRWVIKTSVVQRCSWQPRQNFHYPQMTSADCFSFGLADLSQIYFVYFHTENRRIFRKWNCLLCLASKLVRAELLLLNQLTLLDSAWCLIWICRFWHAWHLVLEICRAVFHLAFSEETNSDMFNRENNIELSAILILYLGLII